MVDSGASSSVMPQSLANKLGLFYEPNPHKGIVQLDGSTVKTVGIIKNLAICTHP